MTLASTINDCLNAVTWTNTDHVVDKVQYGHMLGKFTGTTFETEAAYFNGLGTYDGYANATRLYAVALQRNVFSAALTTQVKDTLDDATMVGYLPLNYITGGNYFICDRYGYGLLYRYAKEYAYSTGKWDASLAWQQWKAALVSGGNHGVKGVDANGNTIGTENRFYDENAQSLDFLLSLYELDKTNNAGAFTYARDTLWPYLNSNLWSVDHYEYRPTWGGYECEGSNFPLIIGELRALNGFDLTNWANVLTDIKIRFLTAEWDAPQWTYSTTKYYSVVHHHTDNDERRLNNTLPAWIMLHAFYQLLDSASKTHMQSLLDGATKAWEYLLSSSGLYDSGTKKFKDSSAGSTSDFATARGTVLLFLLGIVPQTGSLYVPLNDWQYEGAGLNEYFQFDYANRQIRIPVKAGTVKFIYGSTAATRTFPADGVYDVKFSQDWNYVSKATKLRDLDVNLLYVASPEPAVDDNLFKRMFSRAFQSQGTSVTRRKLVLGIADTTTGWFYSNFDEEAMQMWVVPKESRNEALAAGLWVQTDAVGVTAGVVKVGDQVKVTHTEYPTYYEVAGVEDYYVQGKFACRKCDLKELPLKRDV